MTKPSRNMTNDSLLDVNLEREINMNKVDLDWLPLEFQDRLFSIIVPSYNRAHTILETLDSAWAQTYRPIEVVVVDDGSTDDTKEVVEKWTEQHAGDVDFHLSYEFQENAGVCAARNRALRKCKGSYIQFVDSDDTIYPERMERLVCLFKESGCDYIETGFEGFLEENREVVETHYGHTISNHLDLLLEGRLWPNTLRPAYTRDLISRNGPWNEEMVTLQDYEYVIRALTLDPTPACEAIHDVLASARRDGGARLSDIIKQKEGRRLRINCERILCDGVRDRQDITDVRKEQLASRLYALAFRCNGSGWTDLGRECASLADGLNVRLSRLGMRRRLIYKMGRVGAVLYGVVSKLKGSANR